MSSLVTNNEFSYQNFVPIYDKRGFFTAQPPSRAYIQSALDHLYGTGDADFMKRGPLDYLNDFAPTFDKRGSAKAKLQEALKKYRSRSNGFVLFYNSNIKMF